MTPEQMVSRLLYRDGLMLVIDKPAGLAVHRGPNGGESLEDHFDALRFGLPRAPALAHRLDRDTSGCLVLGRHRKALAKLGRLFKSGAVGKTYWAVVEGIPDAEAGVIELPLGRLDETRGWWMKHDPAGQPAVTKWKVLGFTFPSPMWGGVDRRWGSARVGTAVDTSPRLPTPHPALPHKGGGEVNLARARAADRPHAPAPGPLRGNGLADPRRCDLRQRSAQRRAAAPSARPRNHRAALQQPRADRSDGAGAAAHARRA